MKTQIGYETNGDYIKYKSGFTQYWVIETEKGSEFFKTEYEADMYARQVVIERKKERVKR